MPGTPLIIIDVQEYYSPYSTQPELIKAIVKHVKLAKKANAPIVCVEYYGEGKTVSNILKEFPDAHRVVKHQCDGSNEIWRCLKRDYEIYPPATLKLCGIFTQDCVAKTADGLTKIGFKIKIIEEACSSSKVGHQYQVDNWLQTKKVKVIYPSSPTRKFLY